jgi:hypothetical protein
MAHYVKVNERIPTGYISVFSNTFKLPFKLALWRAEKLDHNCWHTEIFF